MNEVNIFWFRRDLRLDDNTGLYNALNKKGLKVLPVFIFDKEILLKLEDKHDLRVNFIVNEVIKLKNEIEKHGSSLFWQYDYPLNVFKKLLNKYKIHAVYINTDYEPYAIKRDKKISEFLNRKGVEFKYFKDQVIFEKNDVLKPDGKPYTIYTPYMKKWKEKLKNNPVVINYINPQLNNFLHTSPFPNPVIEMLDFKKKNFAFPAKQKIKQKIANYDKNRDIPSSDSTTKLGIHLRFGTISIRKLIKQAAELNEVFLNELIWREFFFMIMYHFPYSADKSFKPQYEFLNWRNIEKEYDAWRNGKTGYPIVDAGINQLNQTGFMHNRVRMIVASFLTKHLLIDWRWGEAYFAQKLLDYELSSNVGNWQWAASTGCDAVPYFRFFNPDLQTKKYDPNYFYIKKWIPDFNPSKKYLDKIIEHKSARDRTIKEYKRVNSLML